MKAMIFAAGVGSRLRELTRDTPKCMMMVAGRTILEHVIERLKAAGVKSVMINVHHHAETVIEFVKSKGYFDIEVSFSLEPLLLNTGGGLKKVAPFFANEDAFLIHNADIFSTIDLGALVSAHRAHNAIGTLAVMQRPSTRGLYFDAAKRLVGWSEDTTPPPPDTSRYSFCGISVASHELFHYMGSESTFSLITPYLNAAKATGRVWGDLVQMAEWVDIGTPEHLQALQKRYPTT